MRACQPEVLRNDTERPALARVLVPQVLDRLGPLLDLLHLVHDEDAAFGLGVQAGRIPLLT